MNTKIRCLAALIALPGMSLFANTDTTCTLTMTVKNVAKTGVLYATVCDSKESFDKRKPVIKYSKAIEIDRPGDRVIQFELPKGVYAIAVFIDSNRNGTLDFRWGKPKEMVGMTNNPRVKGPPSWKHGAFLLKGAATTEVTLYTK